MSTRYRRPQPGTGDRFGVRRYCFRSRDGDYFAGWKGTDWETVKRTATWTKDRAEAVKCALTDIDTQGWMDLVCGFSGMTLELVE